MNIPYWLLRLLPLWEYICPKCRKGVKQSAHECPHCGEKFPLTIRVPPTILKDPKKLEDYVHKHVFPRVSAFERNYLTKYFTELFNNGFEEGNFSAWTATETSNGEVAVVGAPIHHDSFSARMIYYTGGSGRVACARRALGAAYSTVSVRAYFYWDSGTFAEGGVEGLKNIMIGTDADTFVMSMVYNDGGTYKFAVRRNLGGWATVVSSQVVNQDTWYSVELKYISGTSYTLYVDGVNVLSESGVSGSDASTVRIGEVNSANLLSQNTVYFDCVVVADAYIGPEAAAGQPYVSRVQGVAGMNSWTRQAKAYSKRMPIPIMRRF